MTRERLQKAIEAFTAPGAISSMGPGKFPAAIHELRLAWEAFDAESNRNALEAHHAHNALDKVIRSEPGASLAERVRYLLARPNDRGAEQFATLTRELASQREAFDAEHRALCLAEGERDEARANMEAAHDALTLMASEKDEELTAVAADTKAALRKYGSHTSACAGNTQPDRTWGECDCGFKEAVA